MPRDPHGAERPSDADDRAVRASTAMAYIVAVAGALGATVALREREFITALLVLTTTLGVAALLAATGTLLRALRDIERRIRMLEQQPPDGSGQSASR